MTHVVTEVICSDCTHEFSGVLYTLFNVNKSYSAECPKCNGVTFFYGVSGFTDTKIPDDAVTINYVAKL
ncbi:hypothetical protein [Aliivibrio fischeri]|uniref:hypothetical protein n=1 Tax=Aliivibrio fischeri TaxID=668 RepID=UPI0037357276